MIAIRFRNNLQKERKEKFKSPLLAGRVPELHGHLSIIQRQCLHTVVNT